MDHDSTRTTPAAASAAATGLHSTLSGTKDKQMKKTAFSPAKHGFKFANTFSNHRFIGPLHIETGGRCGGMVYTTLDHFYTGKPIPAQTTLPDEGSALSTYISARQEKSTLNTLDKWVELSFNPFGWRTREFWQWGLQDNGRFEELTNQIDRGRPVPIGLYNAHDAIKHHQVLAIGYDGRGLELRICVYDPNYPNVEKILRPYDHPSDPRYDYEGSTSDVPKKKWLTYLVDIAYRVQRPVLETHSGLNISGQNWTGRREDNKNYSHCTAVGTNFTGATLMQCDFSHSNMERATFRGANLRNSNFANAELNKASFYGADLKTTTFNGARARKANFTGADLKLAKLVRAKLEHCEFHGADLHRADLGDADCDSSNFYGASLAAAKLARGSFRGANFHGANLGGADLRGADFTGANMAGADVRGAKTDGAVGL